MDASPSGSDSDADAHPRVHPAEEPLHGFACAFARGRCGHDELFQPHYTRTNLRKGDKILRCFPHCCPDHVTRSFCGASLHVDVRWTPPTTTTTTTAPDVLVFARFRVQDARGRVPGDLVTLAEIAQSRQSESNPHGEWIAAASVATASSSGGGAAPLAHEWVFELNHEARWYYHWESGVAKRHRLKHHVLDVYVLSPSVGGDAGDARRPLQVVAVVRSPPFRLISFRRATPKAVQALAVPRVQRTSSGSVSGNDSRDSTDAAPSSATREKRARPSAHRVDDEEEEKRSSRLGPPPPAVGYHQHRHDHYHPSPHTSYASPPAAKWSPPTTATRGHHADTTTGRPSFADLTSFLHRAPQPGHPRPALPPPPPPLPQRSAAAAASQRLLLLARGLRVVGCADTIQYMDTFQRVYDESLARVSGVASSTAAAPPTTADTVYRLLADAGVLDAPRRTRHALPPAVVAMLCELLLWLSFDVDLHYAVHAMVARDASAVLSPPRLQTAFAGLIEFLERHVDAFLHDRGWRLEDLVREIDVAAAGGVTRMHHDDAFASALRVCVAQLSEHCATQAKARATRLRHHVPPRGRTGIGGLPAPLLGRRPSHWALNGDWSCELLRGGVAVRSLGPPEELSLQTLLAVMREIGTIRVRVGEGDPRAVTLDVCSLLNPHGVEDELAATRLTLDQSGHWFRRFPSGLSTGALTLGGLQWGDHVGEAAWASEAVQCRLYAWSVEARCLALELWTPTADELVVRVACSRGAVDAAAASQQLPFGALAQKLRLVRAWQPAWEAELRYTRRTEMATVEDR